MSRLARHVFTAVAALSLLLCLAVGVPWVRSYHAKEVLDWRTPSGWREIVAVRGYLTFNVFHSDPRRIPRYQVQPLRYRRQSIEPWHVEWSHYWLYEMGGSSDDKLSQWRWAGISWHERRNARLGRLHASALVPLRALALITAVLPLAWACLRVRQHLLARRRLTQGLCQTCGYDLRATPLRCPECGHAPLVTDH
jgi:hypothetical protein